MRVLLDHNVPQQLRHQFVGVDVMTSAYRGWADLHNGQLLRAAALEFDAMITLDRGFQHEQSVAQHDLAVFLLRAKSTDIDDLLPLVADCRRLLGSCQAGRLYVLG